MSSSVIFNDWSGVFRSLAVGVPAYVALIFLLRISGKRTLSKMNAFDLVVTVALGSSLASTMTSKDIPLAEGVTTLAVLIGLQFVVTWVSVRHESIGRLVRSEPRLLYHNGQFLRGAMLDERVMEPEVRQAVRSQGISSMDEVDSVVLEADGTFSAIRRSKAGPDTSLTGVRRTDD